MLHANTPQSGDRSTPESGEFLDYFSADYWIDPYPMLGRLRTQSAAVKNTVGVWEFLRYDDVEALFRDPRTSAAGIDLLKTQGILSGPFFDWWKLLMFQNEGETHTRLRRLAAKLLTREALDWAKIRTAEIANQLLDSVASTGRMDILADFAHRLPIAVVCELMGLPAQDHQQIGAWSDDVTLGQSIFIGRSSVERIDAAVQGLCEKSRRILEDQSRRGRHLRFVRPLLDAMKSGYQVTEEEVVTLLSNLIHAGHTTTKNLIGNGILALLRNPDQMEILRRKPYVIKSAVEEFLRYDAPVAGTVRRVLKDFSAAGIELHENEFILLSILGANRDPSRFPNSDQLDIERTHNRHLSFGWGSHLCLGASLARLEASVAIPILLTRCIGLEVDAPSLNWRRFSRIRGLDSLPVRFTPA